jgi:hypothetical protein
MQHAGRSIDRVVDLRAGVRGLVVLFLDTIKETDHWYILLPKWNRMDRLATKIYCEAKS